MLLSSILVDKAEITNFKTSLANTLLAKEMTGP